MLDIVDILNIHESFKNASMPPSDPYNEVLMKLATHISFNMNVSFTSFFNPNVYLPYFQLWKNKELNKTPCNYAYIDRGFKESYILLYGFIGAIKKP